MGALLDCPGSLRLLDPNGTMVCATDGPGFELWYLPPRRKSDHPRGRGPRGTGFVGRVLAAQSSAFRKRPPNDSSWPRWRPPTKLVTRRPYVRMCLWDTRRRSINPQISTLAAAKLVARYYFCLRPLYPRGAPARDRRRRRNVPWWNMARVARRPLMWWSLSLGGFFGS